MGTVPATSVALRIDVLQAVSSHGEWGLWTASDSRARRSRGEGRGCPPARGQRVTNGSLGGRSIVSRLLPARVRANVGNPGVRSRCHGGAAMARRIRYRRK